MKSVVPVDEQDYYGVLGVAESASQPEIKQAYRALARKYHPDRNPGDTEAESKFKDAAEAYRVLGDVDLRAQYDAHRASGARGAKIGETPDEVLRDLFGSRRRGASKARAERAPAARTERPRAEREASRGGGRGADLRYNLEVSIEEAALGTQAHIVVPAQGRCRTCGGTGARPGSAVKICDSCRGSGTVRVQQGFFDRSERCGECDGTGRRVAQDCPTCRGSGVEDLERSLTVPVPAGVTDGTRLKLAGEGLPGERGGTPGDLFVVVSIKADPFFAREGDDLVTEVPVSFVEAALGAQVEVPTLDGVVRMRVPPGSQSGRVFRLKGKGLVSADGRSRGDQRVRVVVDVPLSLSDEARELLERYAELEGHRGGSPRIEEYRRSLRARYGDDE